MRWRCRRISREDGSYGTLRRGEGGIRKPGAQPEEACARDAMRGGVVCRGEQPTTARTDLWSRAR